MNATKTAVLSALAAAACLAAGLAPVSAASWKDDPAWYDGKAEWALYDAVRPLYGIPRRYEATIYTNKQVMNPATTTKAADWRAPGNVEVFKHNCSEMIPTENYTYRFITTAFVRTGTLRPFKLAASSQEDCGTTYRQFVVDGSELQGREFCYFPEGGERRTDTRIADLDRLAFHDTLSLQLRDFPFDAPADMTIDLVPDQTDTHQVGMEPVRATVSYVGSEKVRVPYGSIDAHHLRVTHPSDGGATQSDYWFAADSAMRHVMVKYKGPYGVEYELKKLGWWAYWDRSAQRPG